MSLLSRLLRRAGISGRAEAGNGRLLGVWTLTLCLAAVASTIALTRLDGLGIFAEDYAVPWWSLIPLFVLVEVTVVHVDLQRETQTISLSEVPVVLGLFLVTPQGLVAAQIIGSFLALAIHRRQAPVKLAFNLAQFALVTSIAVVIFRGIAPPLGDIGPLAWISAGIATLVADFVAIAVLYAVIGIVDGRTALPGLRAFVGFGLVCSVANTALGLLGVVLVAKQPVAGILLAVPVVVTIAAYRGYWAERRRRQHLEFLYGSMRRLGGARDFDGAVAQLLLDAREVFRSGTAAVVLMPTDPDGLPWRGMVGPDGAMAPLQETMLDLTLLAGGDGEPIAHAAGALLPKLLVGRALGNAISVELRGEHGQLGVLVVADRLSGVGGFTAADRALLCTYATHAGVALDNRRLQRSIGELARANDELVTRALHDSLTQLPNRVLFLDRVNHALLQREDTFAHVGVLFVDLDDFKGVNDTLGHAAGDQVLVAVAERLRACLRPGDTAARLGGDEFAILCRISSPDEATSVAARLFDALLQPVKTEGRRIRVRASIGIAVGRCGGESDAATLIAAADAAMYGVKFGERSSAPRGRQAHGAGDPVLIAGVEGTPEA
jgi:diguanylate cyclase (GGDEF)-like protein